MAPRADLPPAANFLWMLFGKEPDELTAHAMDVAFILHAEHEFNASSFAARVAAGTYVDLHSSMVAAIATLKGPRHGGANEDVIEMIEEVGTPDKAEAWARDRLQRYLSASREERAKPELRFPGMGHAVYKTWDPRARILQKLAGEVAKLHGEGWIAEIQETVRKVAAEGLGLNPNVDYYSAGLYHSLGIPSDLFTSIFGTARTAGYVAHIEEQLKGGRLIRPRGEYTGPRGPQGRPDRRAPLERVEPVVSREVLAARRDTCGWVTSAPSPTGGETVGSKPLGVPHLGHWSGGLRPRSWSPHTWHTQRQRDLAHQVGATDDADQLQPAQHGHALDLAVDQQEAHLVDAGVLHDADDVARHRLAGRSRLGLGDQVVLADQSNHVAVVVAHGHAADAVPVERRATSRTGASSRDADRRSAS